MTSIANVSSYVLFWCADLGTRRRREPRTLVVGVRRCGRRDRVGPHELSLPLRLVRPVPRTGNGLQNSRLNDFPSPSFFSPHIFFLAFLSLTTRLENTAVQPIFYSAAPFQSGLLFAARLRDRALCIEPDVPCKQHHIKGL